MKYNELGKTGLTVSKLCFGGLTVGPYQANMSPEAGGEVIAYAFSKGINFIDTAQLYDTYPHIKHALKRYGHDNIVIASKTYAFEADKARAAVEQARTELDRDVIDIFLLHEQESVHTLRGHAAALEELYNMKAQGKIRAVGLSTHHVAGVYGAIEYDLDIVHPLFNIASLGIADGTVEEMGIAAQKAAQKGIGVYLMKPFGGGNLLKKSEECLEFVLAQPFADSIAIGMQSKTEVDANICFFEKRYFDKHLKDSLKRKKRRLIVENWCCGCGECEKFCNQNAIYVDKKLKRAVCIEEKCITCGYCGAVCPQTCLKII